MTLDLSLSFHGAAKSTTGSRHLLTLDDKNILMDCGLYQGRRKNTYERNLNFTFDPTSVHSALLSHAHIDHSGNLPNLVKQGFKGPIYCTSATADLCRLMLRDSAFIQEKDAAWINKRNRKRNRPEDVQPIYTMDDADQCIEALHGIHYHKTVNVLHDLKATFYDAGHILGSSSIVLDIRRGEQKYRLVFSGDIGRVGLPLLRDPEIAHNVNWLIMEGTYGSRTHDPIGEAKAELREAIVRVAGRGGKIIVPSFSVERTQEIIYYLNELYNEDDLPPIPIYVDSPLAINVTSVFRLHPECFDGETRDVLVEDPDVFGFKRLSYTRKVEESKKINATRMPCMVISASGMCEAGRIVHHLRNSIEDPKNCILFVGYQAQGTLGRRIVERQPEVKIWGDVFKVRAEIVTLNTMSGHADKNELFDYARLVKEASPEFKKLFLVHGEEAGLDELAARMRTELELDVVIPTHGMECPLEA